MATGWAHEGAVLDQIEDTITDGVLTARARLPVATPSASRPSAMATIDRWIMPAPAPWARTRHAQACAGDCQSADTSPISETWIFKGVACIALLNHAAQADGRPNLTLMKNAGG